MTTLTTPALPPVAPWRLALADRISRGHLTRTDARLAVVEKVVRQPPDYARVVLGALLATAKVRDALGPARVAHYEREYELATQVERERLGVAA